MYVCSRVDVDLWKTARMTPFDKKFYINFAALVSAPRAVLSIEV